MIHLHLISFWLIIGIHFGWQCVRWWPSTVETLDDERGGINLIVCEIIIIWSGLVCTLCVCLLSNTIYIKISPCISDYSAFSTWRKIIFWDFEAAATSRAATPLEAQLGLQMRSKIYNESKTRQILKPKWRGTHRPIKLGNETDTRCSGIEQNYFECRNHYH